MTSYAATPGILSADVARPWGERVRQWRTDRGLSAEQTAILLGIGKAVMLAWERGDRAPPDETEYVMKFRALQEMIGESPGNDPKDWCATVWKAYVRENS